jgi:hypothetical protein
LEVTLPSVPTRIKQADDFSRPRIAAREIWPFVQIARIAGEREVREERASAMLPWNNVVHVERQFIRGLWNATVLAS